MNYLLIDFGASNIKSVLYNSLEDTLSNPLEFPSLFLKDNNFNYRFIDFAADSGLYSRIIKTNPSIKYKLDYSKIIDIDYKKFCGPHQDGHPTAECCTYIADKLNNEFKL